MVCLAKNSVKRFKEKTKNMRFIFKTNYAQDVNLAKHGGHIFWYSLLVALLFAAPFLIPEYWLAQMTFVLIYSVVGLGLMLLAGFTGQFSLGHAAFLGVGAYTQAVLTGHGVPFPIALLGAAALSAVVGVVVGLPALRVKGIYLGMATLSFGFIVEEVFARWESVTGGNAGTHLKAPDLLGFNLGFKVESGEGFYILCLVIVILCTLAVLNILRSPTGRAFVAIRDSEISAQSMGVNLARYKTLSFALSAALAGIGGALYAHKLQFISPDQFNILQSIDLLLMIVVGGLGSVHGAFLGAIFLIAMPQLISLSKDFLPAVIGQAPGLQSVVYGIVLVVFVLFEPLGMYGRWLKIRTYFQLFPFYRKGMFKRQKTFQKSDRLK
jgi:branched-chain amino acid transport system permease protein